MLTVVKNQLRVNLLSLKYSVMREMLNKVSFISNIIFMILNNATFIVQWVVLFNLRSDFGGYSFKQIMLLWGLAAGVYGVAHFFFKNSFNLSLLINSGKLDAYIVQPKNILLSVVTSDVEISAIGDILYAFIIYFIYGFSIKTFILFTTFCITGGLIMASFAVILNSLAFWFKNSEVISDLGVSLMVNFATYPDGIFKGIAKFLLYVIIPVGIANYIPLKIFIKYTFSLLFINIFMCVFLVALAFLLFYFGLRKYSSSNLMSARI